MQGYLLDTNALIWLSLDKLLGPESKQKIQNSPRVYVSALSILELQIKHASGKLRAAPKVVASLGAMQISELPLSVSDVAGYKIFDPANHDPFDNALISIAKTNKLVLVTSDRSILSLPGTIVQTLDARR